MTIVSLVFMEGELGFQGERVMLKKKIGVCQLSLSFPGEPHTPIQFFFFGLETTTEQEQGLVE